jgi:hypothetical protein
VKRNITEEWEEWKAEESKSGPLKCPPMESCCWVLTAPRTPPGSYMGVSIKSSKRKSRVGSVEGVEMVEPDAPAMTKAHFPIYFSKKMSKLKQVSHRPSQGVSPQWH